MNSEKLRNRIKARRHWNKHKDDPEWRLRLNNRRLLWRHREGISKTYSRKTLGLKTFSDRENKKFYQIRKRAAGPLLLNDVQAIYEENIKRFSTLTCTYCLKPIIFGKDTIDHKIPISRGGTNKKENLTIACRSCNCTKMDKTPEEFFEYLKTKNGKKGGERNGYR